MSYILNKYAKYILTKEENEKHEKYIDNLSLDHYIIYNNKIIKTIKQLKKVAKTFDILNSLELELSDQDYTYIFRWLDEQEDNKLNIEK